MVNRPQHATSSTTTTNNNTTAIVVPPGLDVVPTAATAAAAAVVEQQQYSSNSTGTSTARRRSPRRPVALVMGVLNPKSIAWSCVVALLEKSYHILMTCQKETQVSSIQQQVLHYQKQQQLLLSTDDNDNNHTNTNTSNIHCVPCDVTCPNQIQQLFHYHVPNFLQQCSSPSSSSSSSPSSSSSSSSSSTTATLDAFIHSIAYAPPTAMKYGTLLQTTQQDFLQTMDISVYSFLATSRYAVEFLSSSSSSYHHPSIVALTYIGSSRAIPNYNIMGPAKAALESAVRGLALELGPQNIRVNAVSSGPIATVAAKGGIRDFTQMRQTYELRSPLRRNVTPQEVGSFIATLASGDCGTTAMTGQTIFMDCGYHIL